MGIDALTGERDKGLKVTDLVVPKEHEDDFIFDPRKDISPEIWKKFNDFFMSNWVRESVRSDRDKVSDLTLNILTVFPEKREFFDPDNNFFSQTERDLHENTWGDQTFLTFNLALLKLAYPERTLTLEPSLFQSLSTLRANNRDEKSWTQVFDNIFSLAVLFPEKKADLHIDSSEIESVVSWINAWVRNGKSWLTVAECSAYLSVLCPEQKSRLKLDREFWEKTLAEMNTDISRGQFRHASFFLLPLMILSAEKAWIDDKGFIKIIPRQPAITERAYVVPTVREF